MRHNLSILLLVVLLFSFNIKSEVIFSYDFEDISNISELKTIDFNNTDPELIKSEDGKSLKFFNPKPSKYCRITIAHPIKFSIDMVLSCDVKVNLKSGKGIHYLAISVRNQDEVSLFASTNSFSDLQLERVEFPFKSLRASKGEIKHGLKMDAIDIYARGDGEALMEVCIDNIKLEKRIITHESAANPPFLNWEKIGPAVLEYSPYEDFSADVRTIKTQYNFYTPKEYLSAGNWYWRIRPANSKEDGITRCVIIPEKTHKFMADNIDKQSVLSKPRPRLVSPAKLTDDEEQELWHQFENLSKWKIPEDPPAFDSSQWKDKYEFLSQVKILKVMPTGRRLLRLAEICVLLDYDEKVVKELQRWVKEIVSWDPKGGSSPHIGDIPSYHLLRGLNNAYDVLYNIMSPETKKQLRDVIIVRTKDFEDILNNPFPVNTHREYNNHTWLQALVLCESGLTLLGDYDGAYEWAEFSKQLLVGKFLCALGYQGENNEGLAYGAYGGNFLADHAKLIRQASGTNLFTHPWLSQAAKFPIYSAPKNAWAVSFADSGKPNHHYKASKKSLIEETKDYKYPWISTPVRKNIDLFVEKLSKECNDPYGLWYSCSYDTPSIEPKPPVDIDPSIHYEYIGWAILNTNLIDGNEGVTFAIHSGPYWGAHQHADQNGFVINAYGSKLAIDSGYYDYYGSEHFLNYSVQTQAHNAILVNGNGQTWKRVGADGEITRYFDSPFNSMLVGDASDTDIYEGRINKWLRKVVFIKPHLIVIYDDLEADEPAEYEWLLHTVAPIEIEGNKFSFVSEDASLNGTFLSPEKLNITQTKGYPVMPTGLKHQQIKPEDVVDEWTLNAKFKSKQNQTRFITVIEVDRSDNSPKQADINLLRNDDIIAMTVGYDNQSHLICFNETNGEVSLPSVQTDSEIFVVSKNQNNKTIKCAVYGGSWLKSDGQTIFKTTDDAKIDIAYDNYSSSGSVYDISSKQAFSVLLKSDKNDKCIINGKQKNLDAVEIHLAKGDHTVSIGSEPESNIAHPLKPIKFNGKLLEGYKTRSSNRYNYYWWGRFNCDQDGIYGIEISPKESLQDSKIYIDDDLVDTDDSAFYGLGKGIHFIQVSSTGMIDSIDLVKKSK